MDIIIEPKDPHNQKLVDNVHPATWTNPTPDGPYNLVVLGAGTGGLISAIATASFGGKVALIEKNLMGGDCLNVGCVPSKGLISAARVAATVRRAHEFGVDVPEGTRVDFPKVMERMRRLRAKISENDSAKRYTELGVDVYIGAGRFLDSNTIDVDGTALKFKKAIIATGARAAELPLDGLKETGYLTNETLFNLTELPKRLIVVGSGPIGSEMAQTFARFGSRVTLLERGPHLLPKEEPDAAAIVQNEFEKDGMTMLFKSEIQKFEKRGNERVAIVKHEGALQAIGADHILIGLGRQPNVDGLDLDRVGVEYDDRKGIKVNDKLQTTNPRIYAVGDICTPYKFTHHSEAHASIAVRNALFLGRSKESALTLPWCTYTSPEIAHVGLYPKQAEEKGIAIDTFTHPLSHVDRAILEGEEDGFVRVHVKKGTDKIVGATVVAQNAGDLISEITTAMVAGAGLKTLSAVIHPYPTKAEAIKRVGGAYYKTKLTPTIKSLMTKWLAFRR